MSKPGLFVTGTDTGVGKTRIAAAMAAAIVSGGHRAGVLKPVATGAVWAGSRLVSDDTARLIAAVGGDIREPRVTPLVFEEPLAPSLAARRAGRPLTLQQILAATAESLAWWQDRADVLIVEGVGGLLCPLADDATVADLAVAFDYPLVIVARRGLGTLNHTLLCVEAARRRGLRIAAIVLNAAEPESGSLAEKSNAEELSRHLLGLPVLTVLHHASDHELSRQVGAVDWYERASRGRWATEPGRECVEGCRSPFVASRPGESGQGDQEPMPSDVIEPPIGSSQSDDTAARVPHPPVPPAQGAIPPSAGEIQGSSSGDELGRFLTGGRPDPLLGAYEEPSPPGQSAEPAPGEPAGSLFEGLSLWPAPGASAAPPTDPGGEEAPATGDPLGLGLERLASEPTGAGSSSEAMAALGLDTSSAAPARPARREEPRTTPTPRKAAEEDVAGEPASPGVSWVTLLLASYASAVTIGLVWVLMTGRRLAESTLSEPQPAADARADLGLRASHSRRLGPPAAIPAGRVISLGQALQLGKIEVTALEVTSGPVSLERTIQGSVVKPGGSDALKLRLRLRNVSTDVVLAPLDEAYVREREPGAPDSFIVTTAGHAIIAPYPLAVESEWSIIGQAFGDVRPGATLETIVVSAPNALAATTPEMTWRIRLRTDIDHTEEVGVRFRADEVRTEP